MSQKASYTVGTGFFIVLGFSALAYLATQTSSLANRDHGSSYTVTARFNHIGQLKVRAPVKVAGVRIGQVRVITLLPNQAVAEVKMSINQHYRKIPVDSVAAIFTSGLLGDQYMDISYGHAKQYVTAGGHLNITRSSQPLEAMISRFFGSGGVNDTISNSYRLTADFTNVGSLTVGAPVKMAGVVIGRVISVRVDPVTLHAHVVLVIDRRYNQIPGDSAAAVFTSGLIGSQYVALQPGGSTTYLKNSDTIIMTQSAMQLEDLIGKFLVSGGDKTGAAPSSPVTSGH